MVDGETKLMLSLSARKIYAPIKLAARALMRAAPRRISTPDSFGQLKGAQ